MTTEREGLAEIVGVLAEHREDQTYPNTCLCENEASPSAPDDHYVRHLADALADLLAARDRRVRAEALREAADALVWVRPEACPCKRPEDCCGSEASCDAMQPVSKAVGEDWLRARADRIEAER